MQPAFATNPPRVTIIVPTYNRAHTLPRAVDSVLAQDFADWDVVVVDDGSTDETQAVLSRYDDPRIRVVRHPRNRGVAAAKNTGFDHIRGEFYGTLDSDDELVPEALGRLLSVFDRHPEVDQVICGTVRAESGEDGGAGMTGEGPVDEGRVVFTGDQWSLTRTTSLGSERHNTALKGFEEVLWYKLAEHQRRYFIPDRLLVIHSDSGDRITGEGRGARYDSFVALLQTEPEHVERVRRRAPEVRARFWFDAGVEFLWAGDRERGRMAFEELRSSGAATVSRTGLLRIGLLVPTPLFRAIVRLVLGMRSGLKALRRRSR